MRQARILILDDDPASRRLCAEHLRADGYDVEARRTGDAVLGEIHAGRFDVVVADLVVDTASGRTLLEGLKRHDPALAVVVLARTDSAERAVAAMHAGAQDYLCKPVHAERLRLAVLRALEGRRLLRENERLAGAIRLYELAHRMRRCLDPEVVHEIGLDAVASVSSASGAMVVLPDEHGTLRRALASKEVPAAQREGLAAAVVAAVDAQDLGPAGLLRTITVELPDDLLPGSGTALLLPMPRALRRVGIVAVFLPRGVEALTPQVAADVGFLVRHLGEAADTAERYHSAQELLEHDELTDLYNARALTALLARHLGRGPALGGRPSVLFLDIDRFKQINDRHGHLVGSRVLIELGMVLRRALRDVDAVGRFGGDEFVVLLAETDAPTAFGVAERVRAAVEEHRFLSRELLDIAITVTIGVSTAGENSTAEDLLRVADEAMYRGKSASRNVIVAAVSTFGRD